MDRALLFDIVYALAARDGRETALFGSSVVHARTAFEHSLAGNYFPELWFELPLAGEPWFDLHVGAWSDDLPTPASFEPETCDCCAEAFAWFAAQGRDARQLILSWDTGVGNLERPAVHMLTGSRNTQTTCGFLEAAERADAVPAYKRFVERLPQGWFACYAGVFPQRTTPFLRVECIPPFSLQRAYAQDASLLEAHLRQVGFAAFDDELLRRCQTLSSMPFGIEFQFDVEPNGGVSPTLGVSLRFAQPPGSVESQAFDTRGAAGALMEQVGSWGLADGRWRLLADTSFSKRLTMGSDSALLWCFPAFLKLRWKDAAPLDAKAYLVAGVSSQQGLSSSQSVLGL